MRIICRSDMVILQINVTRQIKPRLVLHLKEYSRHCFEVAVEFFEKSVAMIVAWSVIFWLQFVQHRNSIGEMHFLFF